MPDQIEGQMLLPFEQPPTCIYVRIRPSVINGKLRVDAWCIPDAYLHEPDDQGLMVGQLVDRGALVAHMGEIAALVAHVEFAPRSQRP
jgi:hypothetical protein